MLPEVTQLNQASSLVRIPPADGVPLSARVRRVIDTAPMRRLASISQLGMVSLVYPGATHSRLEHSLGVYLNSLRLLARFAEDRSACAMLTSEMAEAFVLAALLHDVGHWPFCHPIEDMRLRGLHEHESRVADWIENSELADCIDQDWSCGVGDVIDLLEPKKASKDVTPTKAVRFLRSCLSGPIDIDKIDYLQRDSLHAGVPYGRNFDVGRLISSMCVHPLQQTLAIGDKGRTAAEMMVFARYVMFSEVYWHHTVRSATAMLQRAVFSIHHRQSRSLELESTFKLSDADWIAQLQSLVSNSVGDSQTNTAELVDGLFGKTRRLYKRVAEFHSMSGDSGQSREGIMEQSVHRKIARRPYWWLVKCSEKLADRLTDLTGQTIQSTEILVDAPPAKLEVDINIDVISQANLGVASAETLADVSPVARALAFQQFDNQVKRVRVFVHPQIRSSVNQTIPTADAWTSLLLDAIAETDKELI
ncbi:HD domain protein [Planctomycetes bacterium CA13]|uniref:HD domain protein n=2 Tax=Novipirellula herctigrandis TaxID=2527986 RepID=A0A5C5YWE1_9BACT|nr:HD domain protein [Planctomycetes bacterium CA13]